MARFVLIEIETDHTPQLSMTNELAKALHRFATHLSAGARMLHTSERAAAGESSKMTLEGIGLNSILDETIENSLSGKFAQPRGGLMEKQNRLDGQVALAIGRSRGIGAGIVRGLTPEGAAVALHRSKNAGSLDSTAEV